MGDIAKIRCPGGLADELVIERAYSACGDVDDGIAVRFDGRPKGVSAEHSWSRPSGVGFVMSWADFEAAYLAVKAARAVEAPPDYEDGEESYSLTQAGSESESEEP